MNNPWNIYSIYELQFFNCPSCMFRHSSKQEIVYHAFECHPESVYYLSNISDNSLSDVSCPWNPNPGCSNMSYGGGRSFGYQGGKILLSYDFVNSINGNYFWLL